MNFIMEGYFIILQALWLHIRLCVPKGTCLGHPFITSKGASGCWSINWKLTGILLHKICVKSSSNYAVLYQAMSTSQSFSHVATNKSLSFSNVLNLYCITQQDLKSCPCELWGLEARQVDTCIFYIIYLYIHLNSVLIDFMKFTRSWFQFFLFLTRLGLFSPHPIPKDKYDFF